MGLTSSEHKTGGGYIAFFDLDQTLINNNSGILLARYAYRNKLMKWPDLIRAVKLSLSYRLKLSKTEKILSDMIMWIKGVTEVAFNDLCREIFEEKLYPSIYYSAVSELAFHKLHNGSTVILSSAVSPVCRAVAGSLKMDGFISTELEVKDGRFTGCTTGKLCYGPEKASRLKEYCEKNYIAPGDCWYYGDSFSDLAVLKIVGHPVCVNPDNKLKRIALENRWKINYWM